MALSRRNFLIVAGAASVATAAGLAPASPAIAAELPAAGCKSVLFLPGLPGPAIYTFDLDASYAILEPLDWVTVDFRGPFRVQQMRVTRIEETEAGRVTLTAEAVNDD